MEDDERHVPLIPDAALPVAKTNAKPPSETRAYKLGKAAGSMVAALGFMNQVWRMLKRNRDDDETRGFGRGTGRGSGRMNRRRRS